MVQWGRKDVGVREEEIKALYNNIPTVKKFVVYENSGHENLYENEPEKWEENVEGFLEEEN